MRSPGVIGGRLAAWPGVEVGRALSGGARAVVRAARRGDERLVVKVSPRSGASLDWELDLLSTLRGYGLSVPETVLTADGRDRDGSVVVQEFLPSGPPTDRGAWRAAHEVVETVHHLTRRWPQRPGAASAQDLLTVTRGADADLSTMPTDAVALVRGCWLALLDHPSAEAGRCVVHGDLGPGAFLVDGAQVSLIDLDEARVDVPAFDLAALHDASDGACDLPEGVEARTARQAALAWEVATCWVVEPAYAARRLEELRADVETQE